MGHEAPVGHGFFRYYWLQAPLDIRITFATFPGFSEDWLPSKEMISSLAHLKWGLYRLYVDALLYFGNVRRHSASSETFRSRRLRPYSVLKDSTQQQSKDAVLHFR